MALSELLITGREQKTEPIPQIPACLDGENRCLDAHPKKTESTGCTSPLWRAPLSACIAFISHTANPQEAPHFLCRGSSQTDCSLVTKRQGVLCKKQNCTFFLKSSEALKLVKSTQFSRVKHVSVT